jgi:RNA polymerase sigma factor (sigma-70 family)
MTREQEFLAHLSLIERVVAWVCARRGLRGADAEDFASEVKQRLIENDYEVLARFEGRSSLRTYLTAVINRLYLDHQIQRFGKWRTSAEARRLGPVAVKLERLLYRDGLSFDEACGVLQTDVGVSETREALHDMSLGLPHRTPRGAGLGQGWPPSDGPAPSDVERVERQALAERTFAAIRRSLARLPARDRLVLRLHYEAGLTIAEIARSRGLDQKALYRRRDEMLQRLRADLDAEGFGPGEARDLLAVVDWEAASLAEESPAGGLASEEGRSRPSYLRMAPGAKEGEE